jgi:hypothetical protein
MRGGKKKWGSVNDHLLRISIDNYLYIHRLHSHHDAFHASIQSIYKWYAQPMPPVQTPRYKCNKPLYQVQLSESAERYLTNKASKEVSNPRRQRQGNRSTLKTRGIEAKRYENPKR